MNNELKHYGVLGMKWGVRRYQNNVNRYMKKEDIRNQKLQKRASELVSKYGDKYKVEVKGNKIVLSDGVDEWIIS